MRQVFEDFVSECECKEEYITHYTTFEGFKSIIENKEFWFTRADYLNDISEGEYFANLYKEIVNEYQKEKAVSHSLLSFLKKDNIVWGKINGKRKKENYICSFSSDKNSLPMWNYYSKSNKTQGVNICLNKSDLEEQIKRSQNHLLYTFQVIYDENKQRKYLETAINKLIRIEKEGTEEELASAEFWFIVLIRHMKYSFKNPCFAYEKEIRFMVSLTEIDANLIEYRINSEGILIPYIKVKIEINNPQITVAPLANYELIKSSLDGFLKKNGITNFSIEKSTCPVRW